VPPLSAVAWHALHLDEATCAGLFEETERNYGEMAAVLLP
jgi:hypothetical protein